MVERALEYQQLQSEIELETSKGISQRFLSLSH